MKCDRSKKRHWVLFAGLSILVAAHLLGFRYFLSHAISHARVPSTVLAIALLLIIAIKHLGLLGPVYALFRRRSRS